MKKFLLTAGFLAVVGLGLGANAADNLREATGLEKKILMKLVPTERLSKIDENPATACNRLAARLPYDSLTMAPGSWVEALFAAPAVVVVPAPAPAPVRPAPAAPVFGVGAGAPAGAGAAAVAPAPVPPAAAVPLALGPWHDAGIVPLPLTVGRPPLAAYEVDAVIELGKIDVLANLRGMIPEGRDMPYKFDENKPLSRTFLIMRDLVNNLVKVPEILMGPLNNSLNNYGPLEGFEGIETVNQLITGFTHAALSAIDQVLSAGAAKENARNFCIFYAQRYMGFFQHVSGVINPILSYAKTIITPAEMTPVDAPGAGGDRFHCMAFTSRDGDRRLAYLESLEALDKEYKEALGANPFFGFKKDFASYNLLSFLTGHSTSITKGGITNVYNALENFVVLCRTYAGAAVAGDAYDQNAVKKAEARASATYLETEIAAQQDYIERNRGDIGEAGLKRRIDTLTMDREALGRAQATIRDLEAAEAVAAAEAARRVAAEATAADRAREEREAQRLADVAAAAERVRKAAEEAAAERREQERLQQQKDAARARLTGDQRREKERSEEAAKRAAKYAAPSLFKTTDAILTLEQIDLFEDVLVLIERNTNTWGNSLVGYRSGEEIMSRGLLAQTTPENLAIIKAEIERTKGLAGEAKISDAEHDRLRVLIRSFFANTPDTYAARISVMADRLIPAGGSIDKLKVAVDAERGNVLDKAIDLISQSREAETVEFYGTLLKIGRLHQTYGENPEWQQILFSVAAILQDHTDGGVVRCSTGARGRNLQLNLAMLNFIDRVTHDPAYGGGAPMGAGAGAPAPRPVVRVAPPPVAGGYDPHVVGYGMGAGAGGPVVARAGEQIVPAAGAGPAPRPVAAPVAAHAGGVIDVPPALQGNPSIGALLAAGHRDAILTTFEIIKENRATLEHFIAGLSGMTPDNNIGLFCNATAERMWEQ